MKLKPKAKAKPKAKPKAKNGKKKPKAPKAPTEAEKLDETVFSGLLETPLDPSDSEAFGRLDALSLDLLELVLSYPGIKVKDLARLTKKHRSTIRRRVQNPSFREAYVLQKKDAIGIIRAGQRDAALLLHRIIKDPEAEYKDGIAASREILKTVNPETSDSEIRVTFATKTKKETKPK